MTSAPADDTSTPISEHQTPPVASDVVAACEDAWRAIQRHHPDVPDVVLVLGTGVERGRLVKLGHWWGGRWIADGDLRGEVLLAGEALHLSAEQVFEVLLHEAAHGLNAARGVKDTSRGGRYHNAHFKATGHEVGLAVSTMPPHGWARTTLEPSAIERYQSEISRLGDAMRIARRLGANLQIGEPENGDGERDSERGGDETRRATPRAATCGCGRRMRMAPSVLAQGPVTCGICSQDFTTDASARRSPIETLLGHAHTERATQEFVPEEITALQQQAHQALQQLAATPHGVKRLVEAAAWYAAYHDGEPRPLITTTAEEAHAMNNAARLLLTIEGQLSEPVARVDEHDFLVGELVMIRAHNTFALDMNGNQLPPTGALGTIDHIDPANGTLDIDFPAFGTHRVAIGTEAGRALTYGYAEPAEFTASLLDLRSLTTPLTGTLAEPGLEAEPA
jgi:hypothetical protein